jgi:hypothetical protein
MSRQSRSTTDQPPLRLNTIVSRCVSCGGRLRADYRNQRTVITLGGSLKLDVQVRRCHASTCPWFLRPIRAEQEGQATLKEHEFGLDIIALAGMLANEEGLCPADILVELTKRNVPISLRSVFNIINLYNDFRNQSSYKYNIIYDSLKSQGKLVLGFDGLHPDNYEKVLWIIRDCISGYILFSVPINLANWRRTRMDLTSILNNTVVRFGVPVVRMVSHGQAVVRGAINNVMSNIEQTYYKQKPLVRCFKDFAFDPARLEAEPAGPEIY